VHAIFGLGNPGNRYSNTRHNIGFIIVDHFLNDDKIPLRAGKGDYYYSEFSQNNRRILLVKPVGFMNRSGQAVAHVLKYFPVTLENILVIYDDFNLPLGTIRFRSQGSDGGHNGIRSIIYDVQSDSFNRLRFGIGDQFQDAVRHVLTNFVDAEKEKIDKLIEIAREGAEFWIENGIDNTMNEFNSS